MPSMLSEVPLGPNQFRSWETLRDGSRVLIRPIDTHDKQAERNFIEGLSPSSKRYRFLGQVAHPSEKFLDQLVGVDYQQDVAVVAVDERAESLLIVGVARYGLDAKADNCECAVTVADQWQQKGLGTALMKHLIQIAKGRGIKTIYSVDAADNMAMKQLAHTLGFRTQVDPNDHHQVIHKLEL